MRVQAVQKMMCEARGGLNTVRSAGTCVTSFPLLRFSQRSLGSRPTKQLVSMGIPAPTFHEDTLPASSASAAGPAKRGGQVYFLPGGPFEVAVRPLPHQAWCIRWGSREGRRRDSFIATYPSLRNAPYERNRVLPWQPMITRFLAKTIMIIIRFKASSNKKSTIFLTTN